MCTFSEMMRSGSSGSIRYVWSAAAGSDLPSCVESGGFSSGTRNF